MTFLEETGNSGMESVPVALLAIGLVSLEVVPGVDEEGEAAAVVLTAGGRPPKRDPAVTAERLEMEDGRDVLPIASG